MGDYFVILTCRNSQSTVRSAIGSIMKQTVLPEYIIVVDDGSTDKTTEIVQEIRTASPSIHVITHPDWGYDIKRVVSNWNEAIRFSKERNLKRTKFHLIATDDAEYTPEYVETLIRLMDSNEKIVIASGTYSEHVPVVPHGAGRLVNNSFLENSMWRGFYPEKMGYESAVLYEAGRCGYNHIVISNARFRHTRQLGLGHKFYEFGASMQTLGYHPLFALGRIMKYFVTGEVTGRVGALYMLYYYLSYEPKSEGYDSLYDKRIRNYVRTYQLKRLRKIMTKSG